jgi:carbonic anhydrase/acetyltransferase-like protein (isoleucine patch superfamily)
LTDRADSPRPAPDAAAGPRVLAVNGRTPVIHPGAHLAPGVVVAGDVVLAEGVSVWFGCVLRSEREAVRIGAQTNIQDLSVVHADPGSPALIGERVTVGHRAVLHGCVVEDDVLIGMGAVLLNGCRVGRGAVVGAGAVVPEGREIPPMALALGVPAKVVDRPVPDVPRSNVANYLEAVGWYRAALGAAP